MPEVAVGGNIQDLVNVQSNGVQYLGQLVLLFRNLFPRVIGSFTMTATATFTVNDSRVVPNSVPILQATNASAGTLQGSAKSLYVSSVTSGSFVVATANATNAAGTETFSYVVENAV